MIEKEIFKSNVLKFSDINFKEQALNLFQFQVLHNNIYRQYIQHLKINPDEIKELHQIPFLPIEFFKTHAIKTGTYADNIIYQSSGTTQVSRSRHILPDDLFYKQHARNIFEFYYGPLTDYIFLALLPSYLEQGHSSLVAMVDSFVKASGQVLPGFYLHDINALLQSIGNARQTGKKIMLFGVTDALLDLAEVIEPESLSDIIIMETGGMKGRRREMVRAELHAILFGIGNIHSEYGMTELLSQAYSKGDGIFQTPPTLKILLRDMNDPLNIRESLKSGGINIINLANVDSCAFIETKDIGKLHPNGSFEVLGRFDNSDIRGCNLLIA